MTGKQVYDSENNYLITPKLFPSGPDKANAFWKSFDWNKASAAGMKTSGLAYSGKFGFAKTASYWPTNHMVSPADQALDCKTCHGAEATPDGLESPWLRR